VRSSRRLASAPSPDGAVVGAVFGRADEVVARVRTGDGYSIQLLSLGGAVLKRRPEPRQEGAVTTESGQIVERAVLVSAAW